MRLSHTNTAHHHGRCWRQMMRLRVEMSRDIFYTVISPQQGHVNIRVDIHHTLSQSNMLLSFHGWCSH